MMVGAVLGFAAFVAELLLSFAIDLFSPWIARFASIRAGSTAVIYRFDTSDSCFQLSIE
jgi:hypothetical protein